MPVTDVHKDTDALTMTVTAEFDAPVERVWQVWEDPRLLERWWGPPTYPATFVDYDLSPGGTATYFMTGPEGERYHGWWDFESIDAPTGLAFEDGFADESGARSTEMPTTHARVAVVDAGGGTTRMTVTSTFPSIEAFDQLVAMGMDEGIREAIGQIDDLVKVAA